MPAGAEKNRSSSIRGSRNGSKGFGNRSGLISRLLTVVIIPLVLSGCYHMRVMAVPIESCIVSTKFGPEEALARARKALEETLSLRVVAEEKGGLILISAPRQYYLDTGFGMPAGGRKYFMQLQIEVQGEAGGAKVIVSGRNFEIRTSYVYSDRDLIETLYKVYPYEEYPGMFNVEVMNSEVRKLNQIIARGLKE